jgi:ABC-2 type transport system permease protein
MQYVILAVVVVFAAFRVLQRRRRRASGTPSGWPTRRIEVNGPVALVATREISERLHSRVFRIGTVVILAVVAAGVIVPVLDKGSHTHLTIGVVGVAPASLVQAGTALGATVTVVDEPSATAADDGVRSGALSLAVINGQQVVTKRTPGSDDDSASALVARSIASTLGLERDLAAAALSPSQVAALAHTSPVPVVGLLPAKRNNTKTTTAVYGLILMFVMLTQYGTWIIMGVVEEKSSRVVEVLLSTMRPVQLLAGKVLGIGAIALAQAALIVIVAIGLGAAVGSDLVKGTAPVEVACVAFWFVLGYVFYCWVYAAGGALAERQEHVQSLILPLQLPILFGYIVSLTALGSTMPSLLVRVLAFVPPTAPFAMTVLVAKSAVTWWEFVISAGIAIVATVGVARLAALVYQRAILMTGRRVRIREVIAAS